MEVIGDHTKYILQDYKEELDNLPSEEEYFISLY